MEGGEVGNRSQSFDEILSEHHNGLIVSGCSGFTKDGKALKRVSD